MILLTFANLSQKLGGRGRTTIYRDIEAGRLPRPIKIGGRRYFIDEEVDKKLAEATELESEAVLSHSAAKLAADDPANVAVFGGSRK